MKTVVITGSRRWTNPEPIADALRGADALIVGDCPPDPHSRRSADALALWIALRWDVVPQVFAASQARAELLRSKGIHVQLASDWRRDGKRAGPLRNSSMVKAACAARDIGFVECHAFPAADSLGTLDCMLQLRAAGFIVHEHLMPERTAREIGRQR